MKFKHLLFIAVDAIGVALGLALTALAIICLCVAPCYPESPPPYNPQSVLAFGLVCLLLNANSLRKELRKYESKFGRRYKLQTTR